MKNKSGVFIIGMFMILLVVGLVYYSKDHHVNVAEESSTKEHSVNKGSSTKEEKTNELEPASVPTIYDAEVTVDPKEKQLKGSLHVQATNDTGKSQDKIVFHIYPNQFRESWKLAGDDWRVVVGENPEPGWIDINSVQLDGVDQDFNVKETILEIPIENWDIDQKVSLDLNFTIKVPKNNGRFSYDEHAIWFGNWLPIEAVYNKNGWVTDPYYPIGDPFYSEVGKYNIKVHVPKTYQVATTGSDTKWEKGTNDDQMLSTSIDNVRDFSMVVMDSSYKKLTGQVGNTKVNTWFLNSDEQSAAEKYHGVALKSLEYYNNHFGTYPYEEYDVIRTGGFFGGMEYPGIVFIQGDSFKKFDEYGYVEVAHETGHQWWYGLVGNDEVREPWLDEALTSYSTNRFLLDEFPTIGNQVINMQNELAKGTKYWEQQNHEFVSTSVDKFSNWGTYSPLVYQKGSKMFYELEQEVGKEKMDQALQEYFKEFQYQNATGDDLINSFSHVLGDNTKEYFEKWLHGDVAIFEKK